MPKNTNARFLPFPANARRACFTAAILAFACATGTSRGDGAAYPPEPPRPKTSKETPREEQRALLDKWHAEHSAWEQNLTMEQRAAWKKAEEDKRNKAREEHRKRGELPAPEDGYDWKQDAARRKLDDATTGLLEKQKIAFGPSVKQSFSPYLGATVFVTSDSLLNAFHVLFEDSFREIELRRAHALQGQLETLLQGARQFRENKDGEFFPAERHAAAFRHAQLVLGPAIVALGGAVAQFDEPLQSEISAQAEKIQRAEAVDLPAWLAPADGTSLLALDYRRCKPVGFYSDNEKLAAYFRATRWLQMAPFRGARVAEFDAILLLGFAEKDAGLGRAFLRNTHFVGPPDDPSASDLLAILDTASPRGRLGYARFDCTSAEVKTKVANALIDAAYYQINSDLRLAKTPGDVFADCSFRLMPASRLPDAVLFQQLINRQIAPRGLAVAAMLGSPFASGRLAGAERAEVAAFRASPKNKIAGIGDYWEGAGLRLCEKYLHVLEALFTPPPPEAPAFVKGEFWEAKNCQTALAGWAQMRHTFTLQAKSNELYFGILTTPPGFIEPNPEFFARMSRLIDAIVATLDADDFGHINKLKADTTACERGEKRATRDNAGFRQRWTSLLTMARTLEAMAHKQLRHQPWTNDEALFLKKYGEKLAQVMGYFGNSYLSPRDDAPRWVEVARDPQRDTALAVAVGRPRYLYVLYPWNGMEILCQGSIMQYYEYDAKPTPLTDAEWLQLLDSPDAPPIPDWLRPFAGAPEKPAAK